MADRLQIQTIKDARGSLSVIETAPFEIKRVYYLHGMDSRSSRGGHAQRKTDRLLIAVHGSFQVHVTRNDDTCKTQVLWEPTTALRVYPGEWLDLTNFSTNAVCLVLASEKYEESDSVRDYRDFLKMGQAA